MRVIKWTAGLDDLIEEARTCGVGYSPKPAGETLDLGVLDTTRHNMTYSNPNSNPVDHDEWFASKVEKARGGVLISRGKLSMDLASLLLSRNMDRNRAIKEFRVSDYANDMNRCAFIENGETIKIDVDGFMIDGQHRCRARILCGHKLLTNPVISVAFGLDRACISTIDQGSKRTTGDALHFDGVRSSNAVAAVASYICAYERKGTASSIPRDRATRSIIIETAKKYDVEIQDCIRLVYSHRSYVIKPPSFASFCLFVLRKTKKNGADIYMADLFMRRLFSGDDLKKDDPIYVLRESLIRRPRLQVNEKFEIILRAWNLFRSGKSAGRTLAVTGKIRKLRE